MKLADLGKREMAIIYILGFVLSAALLYKFVVSPELERYRTGNARFDSQQQRKMRAVSQRDILLDEYLELRAKADKMQKLLLNRTEADDFQEQLPKLSENTGNDLTSITPKDSQALVRTNAKDSRQRNREEEISAEEAKRAEQLSEIAQMPIGVTIKGEYGNIIKLFNTLEGFKELMVVSDVGVSSSRGIAGEVETKFSLDLIHTKTEMETPAGELLSDVSAMKQIGAAGSQQEETPPPARSVSPPGVAEEMRNKTASARSGSNVRGKEASAVDKNVRYAVQVGAFNIVENSKALTDLLESKNYEPWVRPNIVTGEAPHYVLVGKFTTRSEAEQFGKLMKEELQWVDDLIIKRTVLDLDTVLREARTDE